MRRGVSRMKVTASEQQEVVKLVLLWMFSETFRRDGGFVSLKVYTIWKGRLDKWESYAEEAEWLSKESGRLAGVEEPDPVECRGLEESLRYSNMRMVIVSKKKFPKIIDA
jgi:hypothetical protein